ncbi:MAG TPA: CHAP domain-containing protein [Skermanella sp.]|nr:CHAP domain-containing protein [Skermanella sp.]
MSRFACTISAALLLLLASPTSSALASYLNCVHYVKQVSSFDISGNAWMWWNNAKGRYNIGHRPARNSVLVFQRTKAMSAGHVAVVREVVNRRTILIEHANWAPRNGMKGRVSTELVEDISPNNDWTSVRVMHKPSMSFGKPYATNGFIHPRLPALVADP